MKSMLSRVRLNCLLRLKQGSTLSVQACAMVVLNRKMICSILDASQFLLFPDVGHGLYEKIPFKTQHFYPYCFLSSHISCYLFWDAASSVTRTSSSHRHLRYRNPACTIQSGYWKDPPYSPGSSYLKYLSCWRPLGAITTISPKFLSTITGLCCLVTDALE